MNCIIVHGCADDSKDLNYNKHWMPWVQKELSKKNIKTEAPSIPSSWNPVYETFKNVFEKCNVDEHTILIGHSSGCAFLVRWLGENKRSIDTLILVAPWKINHRGDAYRDSFYAYEIDKTIKNRVRRIVMFTSNNEAKEGKDSLIMFHNVLGGKIIQLENHGHYTFEDMQTEKFPELLNEVTKQ